MKIFKIKGGNSKNWRETEVMHFWQSDLTLRQTPWWTWHRETAKKCDNFWMPPLNDHLNFQQLYTGFPRELASNGSTIISTTEDNKIIYDWKISRFKINKKRQVFDWT